jgi:A/G-specific adenine glycosylase
VSDADGHDARPDKPTSLASAEVAGLRRGLLGWYAKHARDLPWRRTRDPYAIWVSEIMLQQTQVATAIPYYQRWMRRFPDVQRLASADPDDVLHAWQGLGYYSRAKSLLAAARVVVESHAGQIPASVPELAALPGVGPYTAGAIASIAHGRRAAIVDGNVERVLCRRFGLGGDPKKNPLRAELWRLAERLVPGARAGDFNQALMELGATVCTPKSPSCERCPWRARCVARATSRQTELPEAAARAQTLRVHGVAAIVEQRGQVLVMQLPEDAARWPGLWCFPHAELRPGEAPEAGLARALGTRALSYELERSLKHSITRYRITLDVFRCTTRSKPDGAAFGFRRKGDLDALAMPAVHRRIADRLTTAPRPLAAPRADLRSGP